MIYRKDLVEEAGYDPEGENWATEPMSWQEDGKRLIASPIDYVLENKHDGRWTFGNDPLDLEFSVSPAMTQPTAEQPNTPHPY